MQKTICPSMEPSKQCCPNSTCCARGQIGAGNIVIHDRKRQRYRCTRCRKTFSARRGTMFEGLRKPTKLVVIVVTLIGGGGASALFPLMVFSPRHFLRHIMK